MHTQLTSLLRKRVLLLLWNSSDLILQSGSIVQISFFFGGNIHSIYCALKLPLNMVEQQMEHE